MPNTHDSTWTDIETDIELLTCGECGREYEGVPTSTCGPGSCADCDRRYDILEWRAERARGK